VDKELIKDIVGRPRWWLTVIPLGIVFVLLLTWLLPDDADSAGFREASRICPAGEWDCYTADRYADDFRAGRFGDSHGVDLPPRVKRMINDAMATRWRTARGDDAWWRRTLSVTACIGGPRWQGACRRGQEFINNVIAETSRVQVACSGFAVIGFLGGSGAWGAGKGAGACLWTRLMGIWD
jgi:hypothetical protein